MPFLNSAFLKLLGAAAVGLISATFALPGIVFPQLAAPSVTPRAVVGVGKFTTCAALKNSIAKAGSNYAAGGTLKGVPVPMRATAPQAAEDSAVGTKAVADQDYSQTNVQVAGVDEADVVKLDGTYAYHLSKNRLILSRINPAPQAKLLSTTELKDLTAQDLYVEKGKVMILGTKYEERIYPMPMSGKLAPGVASYPWRGNSVTVAQIWDVSDPSKPKKLRTVEFDGSLSSTRLIKGRVYLVMNAWSPWQEASATDENGIVPAYRDSKAGTSFKPMARCGEVAYFDVQPSNQYLAVASLGMNGAGEIKRSVILGSSETIYATPDNLYVARADWSQPAVRDSLDGTLDAEKTLIYKFALQDGTATYKAKGTVAGHLLNQFSLDEFDGNLRVATTKGQVWDSRKPSTSNLFVLSSNLKPRGKIEGIAPGEQIYSVRFAGKRGYLVTFKKIDPFFVLDLSNPDAPSILGKLKIPGYSDYLHPMDDTHVIGLGKNADDAPEQSFAWYQGLKLAIFDVSDVAHPKELWKTEIGDRGSDSPALHDHKAFLYAPSKQLLVLPVLLAELSPETKNYPERQGSEYGDFTFQGAYVYRLTLDKGFELIGRVTQHSSQDEFIKSGYYYGASDDDISRASYAQDTLLTFSNNGIALNHLFDLADSGKIAYPAVPEPQYETYPVESGGGSIQIMPTPVKK
ncbi:MAG: beta-propeller domain-containing protein [Patescibacteria group bacterium]